MKKRFSDEFVESFHFLPSKVEGRNVRVALLTIKKSKSCGSGWHEVFGSVHSPSKNKVIGMMLCVRDRTNAGDALASVAWRKATAESFVQRFDDILSGKFKLLKKRGA